MPVTSGSLNKDNRGGSGKRLMSAYGEAKLSRESRQVWLTFKPEQKRVSPQEFCESGMATETVTESVFIVTL